MSLYILFSISGVDIYTHRQPTFYLHTHKTRHKSTNPINTSVFRSPTRPGFRPAPSHDVASTYDVINLIICGHSSRSFHPPCLSGNLSRRMSRSSPTCRRVRGQEKVGVAVTSNKLTPRRQADHAHSTPRDDSVRTDGMTSRC